MSTGDVVSPAGRRDAERDVHARLRAALPRVLDAGLEKPGPMAETVEAMAGMLAPRTALIEASERLFDPLTAPDSVLPWLSGWFGWGWLFFAEDDPRRRLALSEAFPPGSERLRSLLAAWPTLQRLRGLPDGLALTLRIATGLEGIELEQDSGRQHVSVRVPALPADWSPWLRRVIAESRPVHLTWDLIENETSTPP